MPSAARPNSLEHSGKGIEYGLQRWTLIQTSTKKRITSGESCLPKAHSAPFLPFTQPDAVVGGRTSPEFPSGAETLRADQTVIDLAGSPGGSKSAPTMRGSARNEHPSAVQCNSGHR